MHSFSLQFRRRDVLPVLSAALLWILNVSAMADTNTVPTITAQPAGGIAGVGEDFVFGVTATGTLPLSYQWRFAGSAVSGATNSSLLLTNLATAQAGSYAVVVTNIAGSVTSSVATLTIVTNYERHLATARLLVNQSSQVAVPIVLRGNGRENAVSFSLAYNTNAYSNPVFLPGCPTANVSADATRPGLVGVSMVLPHTTNFPPDYATVGLVQFDLANGANALQGGLAFTNTPFPISASNAAPLALLISATVEPQYVLVTSEPKLDRQSGLFKHQMIVSNPGAGLLTNITVTPLTLGYDSRTNAIVFYNGVAGIANVPYSGPLVGYPCNCDCGYALDSSVTNCNFTDYLACATSTSCAAGIAVTNLNYVYAQISNLAPAESRTLTLEFYVSDHRTVPPGIYALAVATPYDLSMPTNSRPLAITATRYSNGTFLIEFPTQVGYSYYVQYDSTSSFTNAYTAFPSIAGTGGQVQWIDDGPPKTISPPVKGSRFYRVFQSP